MDRTHSGPLTDKSTDKLRIAKKSTVWGWSLWRIGRRERKESTGRQQPKVRDLRLKAGQRDDEIAKDEMTAQLGSERSASESIIIGNLPCMGYIHKSY